MKAVRKANIVGRYPKGFDRVRGPFNTVHKTTIDEILELALYPKLNRVELSDYLKRAFLYMWKTKRVYLGFRYFCKRGSYRLVAFDPSTENALMYCTRTNTLKWFWLYDQTLRLI